jgi:hypothetical protein
MNDRIDVFRSRTDGVTVSRIWVAVALSILLHIAALWELPPVSVQLPGLSEEPGGRGPLSLRLVPPAPPVAAPAPSRPAPESRQQAQRPKAVPRPKPPPPVIALNKPAPVKPSPAPAPTVPPAPAPQPPPAMPGDMASYIEARRRARGATTPAPAAPAENEVSRTDRIIADNLSSTSNQTFGYDPARGGGAFQIERLGYDHAEFIFHGWNKDVGRNTKQLYEVSRGNLSDIRLAVVRKMVAIIREYEKEDFVWVSRRLGRSVTLSARPADRAGLEEFMMREFFAEPSPARR